MLTAIYTYVLYDRIHKVCVDEDEVRMRTDHDETAMTVEAAAPRAGVKEWLALAVLAVPAILAATDLSMVFMASPWIGADLEPSGSQLLWVMDIYGFVLAGLLITMGTVGDRIGRRRLLLIGTVIFGVGSLVAAFAGSTEVLIGGRALLGIGAATLAPTTLALVRDLFQNRRQRRKAIGIWAASFSVGFPLGALAGGLLIESFWWGSIFLVNIPVAVLLLVLAPILVRESTEPQPGKPDLLSAGLVTIAVLSMIWSMKDMVEHGWDIVPVAVGLFGLLAAFVFVRRQRRLHDPLIDLELFRRPAFSASVAAGSALTLGSAALGMLIFQHFQLVLGYRPLLTALWMLPIVAATMVGITISTTLVKIVRPAFVVGAGLAVAAIGMALLVNLDATDGIAAVLVNYGLVNVGMGMTLSLAYDLMMAAAPAQQAGAATGINETGTELGGALGIAILGTIAGAVYRSEVVDSMPAGVPSEAADGVSGSLGGAVAVAESLPADIAAPLLEVSREAFTSGINLTAAVGSGLLAVAACAVTFALRKVRLND